MRSKTQETSYSLPQRFGTKTRRMALKFGVCASALWATGATLLGTASQAQDFDLEAAMADRIIGDPNAPHTLEDFSSLTCPHCKEFHLNALEQLKAGPIANGQLKVIYRDFSLNGIDLRAAMMARCSRPELYFPMLDILFSTQANWSRASQPLEALRSIGQLSGLSNAAIEACWQRNDLAEAMVKLQQDAVDMYNITGTPGLVLNGKNISDQRGEGLIDFIMQKIGD